MQRVAFWYLERFQSLDSATIGLQQSMPEGYEPGTVVHSRYLEGIRVVERGLKFGLECSLKRISPLYGHVDYGEGLAHGAAHRRTAMTPACFCVSQTSQGNVSW